MKILKIEKNNFEEAVREAVGVLKKGGVVVVPTDTVYGLAADALNEKAVKKVFEIKGRPADKKLPIFVSSFEMLEKIADVGDERVLDFLKKVWPGKVTCVLPKRSKSDLDHRVIQVGLGVRMPNHELVLKIIEKFGRPITGTSANLAGKPEHTKISELIEEFRSNIFPTIVGNMLPEKKVKNLPDLILDAGDLAPSKPSTVLDCTIWPPKILREGAVSEKKLKNFYKK